MRTIYSLILITTFLLLVFIKSSTAENHDRVDIDPGFMKVLQENAAPMIQFDAPNFLLRPKITHIVEIEIVKAWQSILLDKEKLLKSFAEHNEHDTKYVENLHERTKRIRELQVNENEDTHNNENEKLKRKLLTEEDLDIRAKLRESAFASGHQHHRDPYIRDSAVANVTHWDVIGHAMIALFGDQEPELVDEFIRLTKRGYYPRENESEKKKKSSKTMADSFHGIHPLSSPSDRLKKKLAAKAKKSHGDGDDGDENSFGSYSGHYISAWAVPGEYDLKHGFGEKTKKQKNRKINNNNNKSSDDEVIERPPWAKLEGDGQGSRWVMSGAYNKHLASFNFFDDDDHEEEKNRKKNTKEIKSDEEKRTKKIPNLPFRAGALLHRDCESPTTTTNQQDQKPFSWYVLTSREVAQRLDTKHLEEVAEERLLNVVTDPIDGQKAFAFGAKKSSGLNTQQEKLQLLHKIHQLRDDTKNDRIFGQVLSGFHHLETIANFPQHGKIYASHHFLNRSSTSSSSDSSENDENGNKQKSEPFIVDDEDDNDLAVYPFLEGAPMMHVSIARASVYKMHHHFSRDDHHDSKQESKKEEEQQDGKDEESYEFLMEDNHFFSHFVNHQRRILPHAAPSPLISEYVEPRHGGTAKEGDILARKDTSGKHHDEIIKHRVAKIAQIDRENDENVWKKFIFGRTSSSHNLDNDVRNARAEFCSKCRREREQSAKHLALLELDPRFGSRHVPTRFVVSNNEIDNLDEQQQQKQKQNHEITLLDNFIKFSGGVPPAPNCTFAAMTWQWCIAKDKELVDEALRRRLTTVVGRNRSNNNKNHKNDSRRKQQEERRKLLLRKRHGNLKQQDDDTEATKSGSILNPLNDIPQNQKEQEQEKQTILRQNIDKKKDSVKKTKKSFYSEIRSGREHLVFKEVDGGENEDDKDMNSRSMPLES